MELQSDKRGTPEWVRFIYIDLRNLLANPIAFTLPTLLILLVNLAYLNAAITTNNATEHLLPIATFLLLSAFLSSLLSIPFEIREGYADRIQVEFGSSGRRLATRIQANAIVGLTLTLAPYLILTIQERFQRLTLDFELTKFALLAVATIYMTTLGTLIGAVWRNYVALTLLGAAILILQVANGFTSHSGWALSSLVERQLLLIPNPRIWRPYVMSIFLFIQMGIVSISPFGNWLNRSRGRWKREKIESIPTSRLQQRSPQSLVGKRFRLFAKQATSITAHMKMIPISLFIFAVYPLISAEDAFSSLPPNIKVPILTSLLVTSLFSCAISIGAYKLSQEEIERDAIFFGGVRLYRRFTDLGYSLAFTMIGTGILLIYSLTNATLRSEILSTQLLKPFFVIVIAVPLFTFLARKITNLKIDVRFFVLFSVIIPIGEIILAGTAPQISSYLPSSALASLAGGEGLYELMAATG